MPNWCYNELVVSGSKRELNKFREFVKNGDKPFSFEKIIPTPKDLNITSPSPADVEAANIKKHGYATWYEFHCAKWGTKWDLDTDTICGVFTKSIEYSFDTAWSPPIPIYKFLIEKFPKLSFSFKYDEPGCELSGHGTGENGEIELYQAVYRRVEAD